MVIQQPRDGSQLVGVAEVEPVFAQAGAEFCKLRAFGLVSFSAQAFWNQWFGDLIPGNLAEERQPECAFNSFPFFDLPPEDRN